MNFMKNTLDIFRDLQAASPSRRSFLSHSGALGLAISLQSVTKMAWALEASSAEDASISMIRNIAISQTDKNNPVPISNIPDKNFPYGMPSGNYSYIKLDTPLPVLSGCLTSDGKSYATPIIDCCSCTYLFLIKKTNKSHYIRVVSYAPGGAKIFDKDFDTRISANLSSGQAPIRGVTAVDMTSYPGNIGLKLSNGVIVKIPIGEIGLPSYKITTADIEYVASYLNLNISITDIQALVSAFPIVNCSIFLTEKQINRTRTPRSVATVAVGSLIGSVIFGVIGGILFGPPGAAAGVALGGALGAQIGLHVDLSSLGGSSHSIPSSSQEATNTFIKNVVLSGPYQKSSLYEDLITMPYKRYGELPYAGALSKAAPGSQSVKAWYPSDNAANNLKTMSGIKPYDLRGREEIIKVYKYIYVIVKQNGGDGAFQIRTHPEDFYPDTIRASDRVNHSQLTSGSRLLSLFGDTGEEIYGAGSLYVADAKLIGIDTRTGHYFSSFRGQDKSIVNNTKECLKKLGYNLDGIQCESEESCGIFLMRGLYKNYY